MYKIDKILVSEVVTSSCFVNPMRRIERITCDLIVNDIVDLIETEFQQIWRFRDSIPGVPQAMRRLASRIQSLIVGKYYHTLLAPGTFSKRHHIISEIIKLVIAAIEKTD
jgi:hypothetical protein